MKSLNRNSLHVTLCPPVCADGVTALIWAACNNQPRLVELLLHCTHADPNMQARQGRLKGIDHLRGCPCNSLRFRTDLP